mgnify:CR=1 FL=1
MLGTEIPPLVLFQTKDKNEVIDGRQRYETIKRFLEDKLVLKDKGLHSLKVLAGKRYKIDETFFTILSIFSFSLKISVISE